MNVAYPSAIAVYFVSIVPGNATFLFSGKFPSGEGVYHSSLTAYDEFGAVDSRFDPLFAYDDRDAEKFLVNNPEKATFVVQRFYLDPRLYSLEDMEQLLFFVEDVNEGEEVVPYDSLLRTFLSDALEGPVATLVSLNSATRIVVEPTQFSFPLNPAGLFVDPASSYFVAFPTNATQKATISGNYSLSRERPYFDFVVANQLTTQTDDAIPMIDFINEDGSYTVDILASDYIGPLEPNSIRWSSSNTLPVIIMRFIDFTFISQTYLAASQGDPLLLTPDATQTILPNIYPTIVYS